VCVCVCVCVLMCVCVCVCVYIVISPRKEAVHMHTIFFVVYPYGTLVI
jgi:hypothetical protein